MISDNDLLLYYYRDGLDAAERARIAAALSEQPELAARLHRLVARLDTAAAVTEVPVPEHVQQRWQAALERAAAGHAAMEPKAPAGFFGSGHWRMVAAACVVALLVVSAKLLIQPPAEQVAEQSVPTQMPATSDSGDPLAYERGLRWHLASTERQLVSLDSANGEERSELIATIIEQNRLYAIAAERANEPQLARVLRAFTPVLERLAAEPGAQSSGDISQLNFELKVMQARLNAATTRQPSAESVAL
ncbi:MAG TPA: hypothetical protein VIT67_20995 [Povalibacter sp.]|jgi:hypothetical protein